MRLEDICKVFTDGDWIESKDQSSEGIRLVQTGNIGEGKYLEKQDRAKYISEETFDNLKCTEIFPGDILVSRLPEPVGRACIIPVKEERMITAVDCTICRPDEKVVLKEYLCYFMQSEAYYTRLMNNVTGTTRKRISRKNLGNVELNIPNKEIQAAVVEKLNILSHVIDSRKEELEKLDDLIKARFVELFVSKNYPREDLDSLSFGKGEYGAQSASVEYDPDRPRYVRITDINDDGSLNEDYVCSSNIEDDETYKLTYGDFCFARMGATVGKTYAYKSGNQIFAGYLIRYKLRLDRIIPEYLYEFTRLDEYWNWVLLNQSGAAQPGINSKKYGSLLVPVAPLEEQQKFAEFVKQVDKSKVAVQKALDEAQTLFDSLMQEYFG